MSTRTFAPEVSAIFSAMEVPLRVLDTADLGKHVVATRPLDAGFELFEEVPVASWPMDTFIHLGVPHCWWCFKLLAKPLAKLQDLDASRACCSQECFSAATIPFSILKDAEAILRAFHESERHRLASKHATDDNGSCSGSSSSSLPISVESVARCVAFMATKLLKMLQTQNIALADLVLPGVVQQIFAAVTKVFNRFVEPPADSEFDEINSMAWAAFVRRALEPSIVNVLHSALQWPGGATADPPPAVKMLMDGLLNAETVKTIIGQLSLNSQAFNALVILPTGPAAICVGGGLYSLQSNFNHSCVPNAIVSSTEAGNHEIVLKTVRPVAEGEELCISYIPADNHATTVDQRRAALRPYFFECKCSRCIAETNHTASDGTHSQDHTQSV